MKHWIFQGAPQTFNLCDRFRAGPKITTWGVKQHKNEIKEGDCAFVWVCVGEEPHKLPDAGLCACLEVLADPILMEEVSFEIPFYRSPIERGAILRVLCRVVATPDAEGGWITKTDMQKLNPSVVDSLPNVRARGGTNFGPLDDAQVQFLNGLLGIK